MTAATTDAERFAFGKNWRDFSRLIDGERIDAAEGSLRTALDVTSLAGLSFLDIGCGSGLFSLAAARLGARVRSFDYDADAVATAQELHARYEPSGEWEIGQGSVLDDAFMASLGQFDVVYAWGVLHHTGDMWSAIDLAARAVRPGGRFFLSIYNDQGRRSRMWWRVKRRYVNSGPAGRWAILTAARLRFALPALLLRGRRRGLRARGMSASHDLVDWVGGYPFEVARPEQVFDRLRRSGFRLEHLRTCGGGLGCNEFVFHLDP